MTFKEIAALAIVIAAGLLLIKLLNLLGEYVFPKPRPGKVTFDENVIRYISNSGEVRFVGWSELIEIGILTTDAGPAADDVFWMLVDGDQKGRMIPSETIGMGDLLKKLQQLPDFDNSSVISAMGSSQDAKFVCWRRQA